MPRNLMQDMVRKKPAESTRNSQPVRVRVVEQSESPQPARMPLPSRLPSYQDYTDSTWRDTPQAKISEMAKMTEEPAPVVPTVASHPPASMERVPIRRPELAKYESPKYPDFETKFASVNDSGAGDYGSRKSKYGLWLVAFFSVGFLLFALSFLFSSAKITVNPKVENLVANQNLSAVKDGTGTDLPFDVVVVSGEQDTTVTSDIQKDVSTSATGTVVIYNAFSSSPQPLAIDTRLQGSNGKLYKTTVKTTVPGMKGATPGSVEVPIYASAPGDTYNSAPLDFTLLGFKGTPKYSKIYARSKGNITGGLEGKAGDISTDEKTQVLTKLKATLEAKLLLQASNQIPTGFVLFDDPSLLDTAAADTTFTPADNNQIAVAMKGTLSGFLFDQTKLMAALAAALLPNEDVSNVYIPNIKNLTFTLSNPTTFTADTANVNFNLSGPLEVISRVDADKLITDMLGQPKKSFNDILSKYPNIDSAQLVLRPFWKTTLPAKPSDIKVIVNYPK